MITLIVSGAVLLTGFVVTFSGVGFRGRLLGLSLMALGALLGLALGWPSGSTPWWTLVVATATLTAMLAVALLVARRRRDGRGAVRGTGRTRSGGEDEPDSLDAERP